MTFKRASLVSWVAGGLFLVTGACADQQPTEGGGDAGAAGAGWDFPWGPGRAGSGDEAGAGGAGGATRRDFPRFPRWPGLGGRGGSNEEVGGTGGSADTDAGTAGEDSTETEGSETETGSLVIGR